MAPTNTRAVASVISTQVVTQDEKSILVEAGGFTPMRWFLERGAHHYQDAEKDGEEHQQHQKPKKTILPRVRPFRAHHEQAPSPLDAIPRRSYPRRAPTRSLSAPARSTSCTYPRLLCHTAALWLCAGRQRLQHVKLAPCRRLTPIPGTPPP